MDAVCMGELFLDMFPAETGCHTAQVSAFLPTPGGAAANVAVQIARLGKTSGFIGKVGDEAFGHRLAQVLQDERVDTSGVRYDTDARTTTNFIALPDANHPEFLFFRNPGADMRLTPQELDANLIRACRMFYFGSLGLIDEPLRSATLEAVELAHTAGCLVVFDANYRPMLWHDAQTAAETMRAVLGSVDVLKVNEDELALLSGVADPAEGCSRLLKQVSRLIAHTRGPRGSYFFSHAGCGSVPGFDVPTADASGCGDSFIGSLMARLLDDEDTLEQAAWEPARLQIYFRFANAAGALTAMKKGVIPALPTRQQIDGFLLTH